MVAAGISGFMTIFSAATFVVWGGIAYRLGVVAIAINTCYGIAAVLVGYFVAGRWNRLGVTTPAEYVQLRFGTAGLHLFTWTMLLKRILGVSVSLYALGILLVALIPLAEGNPLRDDATGTLSVTWAVLAFGAIVVLYTMLGGLWAVLMTDVLQFIVLMTVVLMIAVMMLIQVSSLEQFASSVPKNFFSPIAGDYGWLFLLGWVTIHFFMVGAEWAFAQRFLAVSSPRDARKSCYLFAAMYFVTPIIWLLPPLIYRSVNPDANPEQAYILAAQSVLPEGMLGLMIAAMFSATASMVSSQLNVFAGVLTNDFYRAFVNPSASDSALVTVGRAFTILLGAILVCVAMLVPYLGGAEKLIISINSLMVVPLLAPALWGLFSRKIGTRDMYAVALLSFTIGAVIKFGIIENPWLRDVAALKGTIEFLKTNTKNVEVLIGVILPVVMLSILERRTRESSSGWRAIEKQQQTASAAISDSDSVVPAKDTLPLKIVMQSLFACSLSMIVLALTSKSKAQHGNTIILCFGTILLFAAGSLLPTIRKAERRQPTSSRK